VESTDTNVFTPLRNFTKPKFTQQHFVDTSYTEFYGKRTKNVENKTKLHSRP